jgi:hypothetical protein
MTELTEILQETGLDSVQTMEFVEASGAKSVEGLKELDLEALGVVTGVMAIKPLVQSRLRKLVTYNPSDNLMGRSLGSRPDADYAEGKPRSDRGVKPKLIEPDRLKYNPKNREYKTWRESVGEWMKIHTKQGHDPSSMYLALLKNLSEEDKNMFYLSTDSDARECDSLIKHLDKLYARHSELDRNEDYDKYNECYRRGRSLKDWRTEWEMLRTVAGRAGLEKCGQDKSDFLRRAELTTEQLAQVLAGTSRQKKDHTDRHGNDKVFSDLDAAIAEIAHLEYAEQAVSASRPSAKSTTKREPNASALVGKSDWSAQDDALFTRAFAKGQGKGGKGGKGSGKGKGKGAGATGGDKPSGWREPCKFGAECRYKDSTCKLWHPGAKGQGKGKGSGKSRNKSLPPNRSAVANDKKPGGADRPCPQCGVVVFGSKLNCFKCGIKVEPTTKGPSEGAGGKGLG